MVVLSIVHKYKYHRLKVGIIIYLFNGIHSAVNKRVLVRFTCFARLSTRQAAFNVNVGARSNVKEFTCPGESAESAAGKTGKFVKVDHLCCE